jgi:cyclophilin family peptidyl-prolyl cis-trans isomerase
VKNSGGNMCNSIKQLILITRTGLFAALLILSSSQLPAQPIMVIMENPGNPLLHLQSSIGDVYLELFPQSAPLNVQRVLDLAQGQLVTPGQLNGTGYYDNLTFHRVVRNNFIQLGDPERALRSRPLNSVADEINARGLGLEQQALLNADGSAHPWLNVGDLEDFQQKVLRPLYRTMGIRSEQQLRNQQEAVFRRLNQMNLMQIYEAQGYRYNASLPSRRPISGSVLMANYGPGTNDGELIITTTDTPWLTGTHTVIGRVAGGQAIVERISREPEASVRVFRLAPTDARAGIESNLSSDGDISDVEVIP